MIRTLNRRRFLGAASVAAIGTPELLSGAFAAEGGKTDPSAILPKGSAPVALSFDHFPSRLHAFVWRNWELVSPERMARVVGAKSEDILRVGRAMGLSSPPSISPDQERRSRITVIRANWHLLPYEQLVQLLGISAEELAFMLREDDFLFVKLGSLKPACEPLRFVEADPVARAAESTVARIVAQELGARDTSKEEPLFAFISELSPRRKADAKSSAAFRPVIATPTLLFTAIRCLNRIWTLFRTATSRV